ncbi:MAG: L-serine ammonia-lyase [Bdellovibrionales bacterium]|nr:L-serine ammonia-lyase [Bdellovibrionales bacterium]
MISLNWCIVANSVLDLFNIGIGPSSSHTVGPMRASFQFANELAGMGLLNDVCSVTVELFGSLGLTGKGHGTDKAVYLGLIGESPENVNVDNIDVKMQEWNHNGTLELLGQKKVLCEPGKNVIFHRRKTLSFHPNGLKFSAKNNNNETLLEKTFFSIGGGFIVEENTSTLLSETNRWPYPFNSAEELLRQCEESGRSISSLVFENEKSQRSEKEVKDQLMLIWKNMDESISKGLSTEGILPGGLKVKRRAPALFRKLKNNAQADSQNLLDWMNLYALAVSEENAAGGRVVTAPTNGAAGIIPAVLKHALKQIQKDDDEIVLRFLLTAGAIGLLYKKNASISGAEVGCQGEVGVACSMAAAALTEVLGGTPQQVENAAEIGMEHNLGLTCDPIGGLVQIPCIERNAMGAVKALNASRLALQGDGKHYVSLDKVIKTMRQTGKDMQTKYKETARGGLAVNIVEC